MKNLVYKIRMNRIRMRIKISISFVDCCLFYNNKNKNFNRMPQHNWDEYFMAVASLFSKLNEHGVGGACIVDNQKKIVGFGCETCNNNAKKKKKDGGSDLKIFYNIY